MRYDLGRVYIREVLTHAAYDRRSGLLEAEVARGSEGHDRRFDLGDVMGGKSRVSEFLNGKRDLSKAQITGLRRMLGILPTCFWVWGRRTRQVSHSVDRETRTPPVRRRPV
jgi:hypothetical protein